MTQIFVRFSLPGGLGYIEGTTTHVFRPGWFDAKTVADVSDRAIRRYSPDTGDVATAWEVSFPYRDAFALALFRFKTIGQLIDKVVIDFTRDGDETAVFVRLLLYGAIVTEATGLGSNQDTIIIRLEPNEVEATYPVTDPKEQARLGIKISPKPVKGGPVL